MANHKHDFLWGASSCAYQTDGADNTQWADWEMKHAEKLARIDHKRFGWVQGHAKFVHEATQPANYVCGDGIRHREFYKEDLKLLKDMGLNAFRFSVEWARIEPSRDHYDENEIAFIKKYIREIKACGLTPIITLWHWTMPTWFTDIGAFEKRANVKYFVHYCRRVLQELDGEVKWILTVNEPMVYAHASYLIGGWPPSKRSIFKLLTVGNNLAIAHRQVYKLAKRIDPKSKVSISHNTSYIHAGDSKLLTMFWVALNRWERDSFFLNRAHKHMDFLGLNWYTSDTYIGTKLRNPNRPVSDLGWDMRPHDIAFSLNYLWRTYHLPILITENGCADAADSRREWWIEETLKALRGSRNNGVELLGYCHWSAFDNFEWDKGFWPRFGLIAVNHRTMQRTPRPSAKFYAKCAKDKHFMQ
ncbi:MAG: family 1 glycosylhydrolase [Candidatus Nomurabacteria bacterium]|jgi:beta-glucosidase|nr:family 1 glycosylhydrolase [Candidatus Nomurabacteria bacterium]